MRENKSWLKVFFKNGIKDEYPDELKRQIEISNFLALLYVLFTFPFIAINVRNFNLLVFIVRLQPIFAALSIILLLHFHYHKLARLVATFSFPILIYIMGALIDDGTFGMAPKFWIVASVAIPFLLFDYTEWRYILISVTINIFLYCSFDTVNAMVNLPGLTKNLDSPQTRTIAGIGSMMLIALSSFYVKKQLYDRNRILALRTKELFDTNQELIAAEEELRENNEELITLNDEISTQKDEIKENLDDIHSSLRYAKSIQQAALMPMIPFLEKYFDEYFIIFRPKYEVGGDFYFFDEKQGNIILAVGDATGHGVPGAMLSMLGISILENLIHHDAQNPAYILNKFRQDIIRYLHQENKYNQDTIDLGLACIEKNFKRVIFAGANIPLYILRQGEVIKLKENRMPLGIYELKQNFTQVEFDLLKGDVLYLFTDGFRDQIGGEKYKKIGRKKFIKILEDIAMLDLTLQKKILLNILQDWQGKNPQTDDITVVAVKI